MTAAAPAPARILARSPNWVGDAVMAVPAIEALRDAFPAARLAVLAVPWVADVFRFVPAVDEVLRFERKGRHRGLRGTERLARELRALHLDLAVTFPRSTSGAWLAWRSGARERLGYLGAAPRAWLTRAVRFPGKGRPGHHELELHLELVRDLGIAAPVRAPRLVVPAELAARRDEVLGASGLRGRDYLAVSPGAAFGGAKRWTPGGFAAVCDRAFEERGLESVLLGGPGERPIARQVASAARRAPVDLAGRVGLADALAIIAGARALLTNDSGLMHAGAAFGVPVVAVFGPTDWIATGPVGERARVVREPVACAPCFLRDCPIDHRCMERVEPARVWAAVQELLGAAPPVPS